MNLSSFKTKDAHSATEKRKEVEEQKIFLIFDHHSLIVIENIN